MTKASGWGRNGSVVKAKSQVVEAHERLIAANPAGSPGSGWRALSVGAVIVKEESDFRYWSWEATPMKALNAYGASIVERSLRLLEHARCAPAWLVFPAGLFKGNLREATVEEDAASVVRSSLKQSNALAKSVRQLAHYGLRGVLVGVDSFDQTFQAPVLVGVTRGGRIGVDGLARRCDMDPKAPKSKFGTRSLVGPPDAYVAYCGEVGDTEADGLVKGCELGNGVRAKVILDLSHYFRWSGAKPKRKGEKSMTGVWYFVGKTCANRTTRDLLGAPVIASTVLVKREPCLDAKDRSRPSAWFAAKRHANLHAGGDRCLQPNRILALTAAQSAQDAVLTVNLFDL